MVTQKYSCVNASKSNDGRNYFRLTLPCSLKCQQTFDLFVDSQQSDFLTWIFKDFDEEFTRETERACSKLSLQGKLSYPKLLTHSSLDDSAFEGHSLICFIPVFLFSMNGMYSLQSNFKKIVQVSLVIRGRYLPSVWTANTEFGYKKSIFD